MDRARVFLSRACQLKDQAGEEHGKAEDMLRTSKKVLSQHQQEKSHLQDELDRVIQKQKALAEKKEKAEAEVVRAGQKKVDASKKLREVQKQDIEANSILEITGAHVERLKNCPTSSRRNGGA